MTNIIIIEIELFAIRGEVPPKGMHYKIRINQDYYVVQEGEMTGKDILLLADKNPELFVLEQKYHGGESKKIELTDIVDFTTPGIERFETIPVTKHVKVAIRYVGNPKPYMGNFMPTDLVETVKKNSIDFFQIEANPDKYYLQYRDAKLNDSLTLESAGLIPSHERVELILSIKDGNDVDGGAYYA